MATTIETSIRQTYVSVDAIPELAEIRAYERLQAQETMARRGLQISLGQTDNLPLAIDALSTAHRVNEAEGRFGTASPEHLDAKQGLYTDCHRLLAEWRRKNSYEVFLPITHQQDEETGEYIANGMSVWQMTGDGLVPVGQAEEDARRVNERVEEATAMHIPTFLGKAALGGVIKMRTASECTDWSIDAYNTTGKSKGGYVPEIKKVMFRDMLIDTKRNQRTEEQVGLPGTHLTHEIIQEAFRRRDFEAGHLDKTGLHGTQLIVGDSLKEFVALLDQVATEEWGVEILMGEEVPEGTIKDYDAIWHEAKERQEQLDTDARMVMDFVLSLAGEDTDPTKAPELVEEFVKHLLIAKAQEQPDITTEMFDQNTAYGLQQVAQLYALGQDNEAYLQLNKVVEAAPGGGYCGAGSCDLVRAKPVGDEADKLESLGFNPRNTLMDKGDRRCKGCGSKTVAYELKKKQKGCTSCGTTAKY